MSTPHLVLDNSNTARHPPDVLPSHQNLSLDLAIPFSPFHRSVRSVAVRLTLANDLHVSFFFTPTKTLTTCRHVYFIRPLIRPNLLNLLCCRKHVHWYCKHALRSKDIPKDPEDSASHLHPRRRAS